jgi:hypothetical protein
MLGPALFLMAILFLTTTVAIAGIGAFARASIQNATTTVIHTALNHAIHAYASNVANQISNQESLDPNYQSVRINATSIQAIRPVAALQDPRTIVAPSSVTEQIGQYFVTEDFQQSMTPGSATEATPPTCGNPAPQAGLTDVATDAQCSPWVWETRMSGSVDVTVFSGPPGAPGSALLAERTETLTFRLFADPPFVAVVGLKDGDARDPTSDDVNGVSPHEGDLGGYASTTNPMVGSGVPPPASDTTIHIYYQCQNPVNGSSVCPGPPFPAGDSPKNLPWHHGNTSGTN